jgi:catechol 2,3-dioxygenase-like lactoylglutathione lyase family enzyme
VTGVALNHVSVVADDLEASIGFYEDLFGLQRLPTPNFGFPVQWLRVGDLQIHLFERPSGAPTYHHFALSVTRPRPRACRRRSAPTCAAWPTTTRRMLRTCARRSSSSLAAERRRAGQAQAGRPPGTAMPDS